MQNGVLFISPCLQDASTIAGMLEQVSIPLQHAESLREARSLLERETFGVILTDARLPDGKWEDVLSVVEGVNLRSQVVVTHPFADARFWADVLDLGAYDLLPQPFCGSEVQRIISNALSARTERRGIAHAAL